MYSRAFFQSSRHLAPLMSFALTCSLHAVREHPAGHCMSWSRQHSVPADVGAALGTGVGLWLGGTLGVPLGAIDGASVGSALGAKVGASVGGLLGGIVDGAPSHAGVPQILAWRRL